VLITLEKGGMSAATARQGATRHHGFMTGFDDPIVKNELLALASVCEEIADNKRLWKRRRNGNILSYGRWSGRAGDN
jgi:hypothetical protein